MESQGSNVGFLLLLWSKWVPDGFRPNRAHAKECDFDMPSCLAIAAALPRQCPWLRGGLQRDGQQGLCLKDLIIQLGNSEQDNYRAEGECKGLSFAPSFVKYHTPNLQLAILP